MSRAAERLTVGWVTEKVGILFTVLVLLVIAALLVAGCTSPAPTPTPTATMTATATPSPTATATIEGALSEALFLEVLEPEDESVVTQATLVVRGRTTPDAVVSVGEVTVDVDAQGGFAAAVTLEPGPNIIEIVASNLAGEQESALRSIVYIP